MAGRRKILAALLCGLAGVSSAQADMVPVSQFVWGYGHVPSVGRPDVPSRADWPDLFDGPGRGSLESVAFGAATQVETECDPAALAQHARLLADGQNSFSLCLYALIGLGLCRSAPWVKKLSLGPIPDWYHNGGPFQMGHRYAIGPDLRAAPVYCFVQPDHPVQECRPQYARGTIASLLRESQFTSPLRAPRGPPFGSC